MKFWSGLLQVSAISILAVIAVGCGPTAGSNANFEDDPDFVRGKNRLARKDIAGSILSFEKAIACLLYTSPSPRDATLSRMPSSA